MKFDMKTYTYYELIKSLDLMEQKAENIVDMLGDFNVKPGSFKLIEKDKDYRENAITTKYMTLQNKDFICNEFEINSFGNITIKGRYGNNPAELSLSNSSDKKESFITLVVADLEEGLHYFTTEQFFMYNFTRKPYYAFYDLEALKTLNECFGLSYQEIVGIDQSTLIKSGFSPDESLFAEKKELGVESTYDFASSILTEMSYSDFIKRISSIDRNNELTQKHKEMCKERNNYTI